MCSVMEDQLTVNTQNASGSLVMSLAGSLTFGTACILKVELARAMVVNPPQAIVFDLQALDFLDSAGYRAMISVPGFSWHPGMLRMRVSNSSQPYRYLDLVGADFLLDVIASAPERQDTERLLAFEPVECADPVFNSAQRELEDACDAYATAFLEHQHADASRKPHTEGVLTKAIERGSQAMRRMDAARERLAVRIIGEIVRMVPSEPGLIEE